MKINQRAIANELNVSTATVSKSLRNSPEVRPETRAQVIELAAKLGYRPTSVRMDKVGSPASGPAMSMGLLIQTDQVIGSPEVPHANMILAGMTEAGAALDVSITVHYVPLRDRERIAEPAFQPPALRRGELSGIVLTHYFPAEVVAALTKQMPCVTITNHYPDLRVDCVDVDHSSAIGQAVDHLYDLGHRRIGFLGGSCNRSWAHSRFAGYVQALSVRGITFDPALCQTAFNEGAEYEVEIRRVIELCRSGVTAWITPSDAIGYGWRRRLRNAGLRVPEDVSITGVDAVPPPEGETRLTSIRVPFHEMGLAAVRRLRDRLREPASPIRRVLMDCQLVVGQSSGPVRA